MVIPSLAQLWTMVGDRARFIQRNALTKDNLRYAIKTALAAALSFLIGRFIDPTYGSWAAVSALFVMQVYVADSLRMSLFRVVGTIIGAIMGYLTLTLLPPGLPGMTFGVLVSAGVAGLLLSLDSRFRLAGLTSVIIIGSLNASDVLILSIDRVVETIVGIFVALLISTVLWPISGALKLRKDMAQQYARLADTLTVLTTAFVNRQAKVPSNVLASLHSDLVDDHTALGQLREYDKVNLRNHYGDLPILINGLSTLRTYMALMVELLNTQNGDGVTLKYEGQIRSLTDSINLLLRWAGDSRASPAPTTKIPELLGEDNPFYPDTLPFDDEASGIDRAKITQALAFCYALNHLASQAETLREQLLRWQSGARTDVPDSADAAATAT